MRQRKILAVPFFANVKGMNSVSDLYPGEIKIRRKPYIYLLLKENVRNF